MRNADRALVRELQQLAESLPPKQASAVHAAAKRIAQLTKGQPAPVKLTAAPPITTTPQRASLQPKGNAHGR